MRSSLRLARVAASAERFRLQLGRRGLHKQAVLQGSVAPQQASRDSVLSAAPVGAFRPEVPSAQSLDTKDDRVVLLGPDLTGLRDVATDQQLRNVATPLLRDGREGLPPEEAEGVRRKILEYFHKTFTLSEKLHEVFTSAPALYEKHEQLRHPPIFYLGHTASFYVNKLHLGKFISQRIDPELEMQMAVGVDEMSWDDLDSNSYIWPSGAEARADPGRAAAFLQKVLDFRRAVRLLVDEQIRSRPVEWPIEKDSFWWVIMMGIEHDRIHLETSSVIHRQAPLSSVRPKRVFPRCEFGRFDVSPDSPTAWSVPSNRLLPVEEGSTRLGRPWDGTKTYGWDNEFGVERRVEVPMFAASEFLVSNYEFLSFVRADGYLTERYWSEEGWRWASDMRPRAPRFWVRRPGGYYLRTLCEEVPMPWDWPVEVCHHEAAAFCNYLSEKTQKTLRLPTEGEYLRLRDTEPTDLQDSAHGPAWGAHAPGNVNLAYWASACPVDTFKSPGGFYDVLGNVWQHSATDIDVLDGFASHPLYDDFTTPTVDGLHARIMGGSFISTGANGATRDSRYGFRRHFYQHAGFRYVESERPAVNAVAPYEKDRSLCDLLRFHFDTPSEGDGYQVLLAKTLADVLTKLGRPLAATRALELGCGPGRTTLELARLGLHSVHGAERTAKSFQGVARLLEGGKLRWTSYLEGEHSRSCELSLSDLGLEGADALSSVHFHQIPDFVEGDTRKFCDFDLLVIAQPGVLAGSDPLRLLESAHRLVRPGGILAVGTQYEWSAAGAAAPAGAGGYEVLAEALRPHFEPVAEPIDLPFELGRTARMSETGVQHLTFWQRTEAAEGEGQKEGQTARSTPSTVGIGGQGQGMYDEEDTVGHYLDFHYGPQSSYPAECAQLCAKAARDLGVPLERALEVGSGPGRAAFELSKSFAQVDAGDFSKTFVNLAERIARGETLQWHMPLDRTGGQTLHRSIKGDDLQIGNVSFQVLDAHALPDQLRAYDLICGFNLIDRLERPKDFLSEAKARLNPGGLLVLSSPYTWREDFTPKANWLGGFKYGDNDGPSTYEGLKSALEAEGFAEALDPEDVWFRIEELGSGRKSQQTRAQVTYWRLAM